jgi:hypothetical protein
MPAGPPPAITHVVEMLSNLPPPCPARLMV